MEKIYYTCCKRYSYTAGSIIHASCPYCNFFFKEVTLKPFPDAVENKKIDSDSGWLHD
jgi:hypothetical protein